MEKIARNLKVILTSIVIAGTLGNHSVNAIGFNETEIPKFVTLIEFAEFKKEEIKKEQEMQEIIEAKSKEMAIERAAWEKEKVSLAMAQKVINIATAQQGIRYNKVGDATHPSRGYLDCSGLMLYSYRTALGVNLPRTADMQRHADYVGEFIPSPVSNKDADAIMATLKPGDMIYLQTNSNSRVDHVVMYMGDGRIVHASALLGEVGIQDFKEYLAKPIIKEYVGARRIIEFPK